MKRFILGSSLIVNRQSTIGPRLTIAESSSASRLFLTFSHIVKSRRFGLRQFADVVAASALRIVLGLDAGRYLALAIE
jgi:hypothetical protein